MKLTRKRNAGDSHVALDAAGSGNVAMVENVNPRGEPKEPVWKPSAQSVRTCSRSYRGGVGGVTHSPILQTANKIYVQALDFLRSQSLPAGLMKNMLYIRGPKSCSKLEQVSELP